MNTTSHVKSELNHGLVLKVNMQGFNFTAYVVIGEANLNEIANIVPQEDYINYGNLHVADLTNPSEAQDQLNEITFNMDPNDAVVFFCANQTSYTALLRELGHNLASQQLN